LALLLAGINGITARQPSVLKYPLLQLLSHFGQMTSTSPSGSLSSSS
jgi:hypothetical protein